MASYLVLGIAKSGTSALYAALKKALPDPLCLFEPGFEQQMDFLRRAEHDNKLAKILYSFMLDRPWVLSFFNKKIHIVRDPRDVFVSFLLYWPLLGARSRDPAYIDALCALLEKKEQQPSSVAIIDILQLNEEYGHRAFGPRRFGKSISVAMAYDERIPDIYTVKYDQLVSGDVGRLEGHLGMKLPLEAKVGSHISFNERQKSTGGWRNWFTPRDVEKFRPFFSEFISHYKFEESWDLNNPQVLDPNFGSEYIRKSIQKIAEFPTPDSNLRDVSFYTPRYLAHLQSACDDGMESAIIELGLAHLAGRGVERDPAQFVSLIKKAAERRNPMGLIHMGVLYKDGIHIQPDAAAARECFRGAAAALGPLRVKKIAASKARFYESLLAEQRS